LKRTFQSQQKISILKKKEDIAMTNIIKNTVLAGLGLVSLTHEKAEEFAKELIRRV
jgi:hypothetical protein